MLSSMPNPPSDVETRRTSADAVLGGEALIVAPHPDDEILGCGGLIAASSDPVRIRVLVASDGAGSPPAGASDSGLAGRRLEESLTALEDLGIPPRNVLAAGLPDGELQRSRAELRETIASALVDATGVPRTLLVPFRFDRHPDHMAVCRAGLEAARRCGSRVWEYFVYPTWKWMRPNDIRAHLQIDALAVISLEPAVREAKRRALDRFTSQIGTPYPGQVRPVLSEGFLDALCSVDEVFLDSAAVGSGSDALRRHRTRFAIVRRLEPPLKRAKDRWMERLGPRK